MIKTSNFLFLLSLITSTALIVPNQNTSNIVYANELNYNCCNYISVIGEAQIEKPADYVELCFCFETLEKDYQTNQDKIKLTLNNLQNDIKNLDPLSKLNVINSYTSSDNNNNFKSICNFTITSSCFDCIDKIINTAGKNGVNNFYETNYIIKDQEELTKQVFNKANEDANKKAKTLNNNCKLLKSRQLRFFNIPKSNNKNIILRAKVKNYYKIENTNDVENQEHDIKTENKDSDIKTLEEPPIL